MAQLQVHPTFSLHMIRAQCRALLAVLREDKAAEAVRTRLASTEEKLAVGGDRLEVLAQRLELTDRQRDFLWTAVAVACEPRMLVHMEALDGPAVRRGLTLAAYCRIAQLDDHAAHQLALWLGPDNPLVEIGLLALPDTSYVPTTASVAVSPQLARFLAGDDRPAAIVTELEPPSEDFFYDEAQRVALHELATVLSQRTPTLVIVEGQPGSGRRTAIASAARAACVRARFDSADGLAQLMRALRREQMLHDVLPVLADFAPVGDVSFLDAIRDRMERAIHKTPGPFVITTSSWRLDLALECPVVRVRWPVADVAVRRDQWAQIAREHDIALEGDLDQLAFRYRIGPGGISRALRSARLHRPPGTDAALATEQAVDGIRHNIAERIGGLAQRVEVHQTWDDLVLPDDTHDQVRSLVARVRHSYLVLESWGYRKKLARGQGVAALFSGPPGTGKTMVAGLIANELGLDMYQVDLSQIVSKWVGETEKQLARVFEAAEEGHALLLFDEADALFGQRSVEMKGATDRYANMEVNYLLQRIEAFGGMAVLTTNLDQSIDRALRRRLAAHITFGVPDEDERKALWTTLAHTQGAPLAHNLDYMALSRSFPTMTGANIRNAAVSAAFLAASEGGTSITQDHLLRAGRAEYRSMGHVLAEPPINRSRSSL